MGGSPAEQVFGRNLPERIRKRFEGVLSSVDHRYEVLAHLWALDYKIAFFDDQDTIHPWVLVPYERLLTDGTRELRRIADAMSVGLTRSALRHISVASSSASKDLRMASVEDQLSKWKGNLNDGQIERILSITHTYGIDMYTEALEPSYSQLNALQDSEYAWNE
jgi:hypothetical protein